MKMEEILKLIEAVSASTLTEFKYEENGTKLNLKKEQQKVEIVQNAASIPLKGISGGDFQATVLPQNMAVSGSSENADPEENLEKEPEGKLIISPLVGTFYAAPAEDAPSFVKVGDKVGVGQVVGIVEAMKLMNEIESEFDGVVKEIQIENEQVVEYGQPLVRRNQMKLTTKEIMEIIPHRQPFLLIDTIEELEPGVRAVGRKCVSYNEPYFAGHFPQEPVMPGVLQIEALAQVGAEDFNDP